MPTEAGPSSGLIRRPRPRATDISEIYAQLREMDDLNWMRLDEVKQEVDRLTSRGHLGIIPARQLPTGGLVCCLGLHYEPSS